MPLTAKGEEILAAMKRQYGDKKGEQVFYASINAGKITGAEMAKSDDADSEDASEAMAKALANGAKLLVFRHPNRES